MTLCSNHSDSLSSLDECILLKIFNMNGIEQQNERGICSKLANIFFTQELARRLSGKNITVNCLHPGFVASEFMAKGGLWSLIKPIAYLFAVNVVDGAKTSVYLASSPEVANISGKYFDKCKEKQPNKLANNADAAKRLWQVSAQLCGV